MCAPKPCVLKTKDKDKEKEEECRYRESVYYRLFLFFKIMLVTMRGKAL